MNRKPTKNTRGPNIHERRFQAWCKEQPCIVTGHPGPSIVHHCEGATFKHNKVLVGHWFCIPLCEEIDDIITHGSRKKFREQFGAQSTWWLMAVGIYTMERSKTPPIDVEQAIRDWGK